MTDEPAKSPPKINKRVAGKPRKPAPSSKKVPVKKAGSLKIPGLKVSVPLTLPVIGGLAAVGLVLFVLVVGLSGGKPHHRAVRQVTAGVEAPVEKVITAETDSNDKTVPITPQSMMADLAYVGPRGDMPDPVIEQKKIETILQNDDGIPPLKREVQTSKEEFYEKSNLFEFQDLEGDKYLAYRVRLPKDWTVVNSADLKKSQLDNRLLGVLAYFVSPSTLDLRSSFRIKAQKLAHMMNVRDWVRQYALANRYTLQALSEYDDNRAEALYVVQDMDVSYVIRMVAIINGPRVVIAEYWVPNEFYQLQKDGQIWSITTFHLKYKDESPKEDIKQFNFFDIASVDYPASWELQKGNIESLDLMDASIMNVQASTRRMDSLLMGRVDIFLIADNQNFTMQSAYEHIGKKIEADQLVIGEEIGKFEPALNLNNLKLEQSRVFKINNAEDTYQDYQYWVTAMKGKNYHFFVCLLMPPKSYSFYNWARNINAYEFVIQHVLEGT